MKTIPIILEEKEYKMSKKLKDRYELNWKELFLFLIREELKK